MAIIAGISQSAANELLVMGFLVVIGGGAGLALSRFQRVGLLCFILGVAVFFSGWIFLPWPRHHFFGFVEILGAILMVAPVFILGFELSRFRNGGEKASSAKYHNGWDDEFGR